MLHSFAEAIEQHIRTSDNAARIDSDEFAAYLPETARVSAEYVRDRIAAAFQRNLASDLPGVSPIGVSAGIAMFPADAQGLAEMLAAAEREIEVGR